MRREISRERASRGTRFDRFEDPLAPPRLYYGTRVVPWVPRCLAGCLIVHVGLDLVREAVVDSWHQVDGLEYACIVAIATVMTCFGFSAGLLFALGASTLAFTLQMARYGDPVRGSMRGSTLRSSRWRSSAARSALDAEMQRVVVVQVIGTLFFGNAVQLKERVTRILKVAEADTTLKQLEVLVIDFTLVRSIDSSAATTVGADLYAVARRHGVRICYATGSNDGFPCEAPLSEQLLKLGSNQASLHVSHDLDGAVFWAEEVVLQLRGFSRPSASSVDALDPGHLDLDHHLKALFPDLDRRDRDTLARAFVETPLAPGQRVWKQKDLATSLLLLAHGDLISTLEDEAGTVERVSPGNLVGDFALLTKGKRTSTVACADKDAVVFVLVESALDALTQKHPKIAYALSLVSLRYMGHRLDHVSNRIWETRCLPI